MNKKQEKFTAEILDEYREDHLKKIHKILGKCIDKGHDFKFDHVYWLDYDHVDLTDPKLGISSKCKRCGYVRYKKATDCEKKGIEALNIHVEW